MPGCSGAPGDDGRAGRDRHFLALAAVVVLASGAALWWYFVRSDAAPPPEIEDTDLTAGGTVDGTWRVEPGGGSYVQYRVKEQLAGAVIESDATGGTLSVTATMRIDGTTVSGVTARADLVSLTSDKDRRDRYIRDNGLQSHQFPTATFVLDAADHAGASSPKGQEAHDQRPRDLTLHGITRR